MSQMRATAAPAAPAAPPTGTSQFMLLPHRKVPKVEVEYLLKMLLTYHQRYVNYSFVLLIQIITLLHYL